MEEALGADGHGFLEQHDALIGLVADELQGGEAPGRPHVEMLSAARGYDKAFGCVHDVPPLWRSRLISRSCRRSYATGSRSATSSSSMPVGAEARRLWRAATPSDPTRARPHAFGRRLARLPV